MPKRYRPKSKATPEQDSSGGLSTAEAERRLRQFGPNAVVEERVSLPKRVLRHFWAPVPWMLEATIALQLAIGQHLTALLIALLLLLNVALGVIQESRAGAALALLKQRLSLRSRVKRDGVWADLPAAELVPGDIVQISLGDVVPADVTLLGGSLLVDQSMLTGELVPARDRGRKNRLCRRFGSAWRGGRARDRHGNADLFRAHRGAGERRPCRERRAEGGVRRCPQSERAQFCHRRGHRRLCAVYRGQRSRDRAPCPHRDAVSGAGGPGGDIHARCGPGRQDAGAARRAADATVGAARSGHYRRAVLRQDRHVDLERAIG